MLKLQWHAQSRVPSTIDIGNLPKGLTSRAARSPAWKNQYYIIDFDDNETYISIHEIEI